MVINKLVKSAASREVRISLMKQVSVRVFDCVCLFFAFYFVCFFVCLFLSIYIYICIYFANMNSIL